MRRRLLRSLLAVTLVGILVLGIPLGLVAARVVRDDVVRSLDREAEAIGFAIDDDLEAGRPVDLAAVRRATRPGRETIVVDEQRRTTRVGRHLEGRVIQATLPTEYGNGRITVRAPASIADRRAARAWLVVGLLALAGVAAAVAVAAWESRRLARPLDALAAASARLGAGDFSQVAPRSGVAEIDAVAETLDHSSERIADLVRREREFSANASHQLRTPLTALRMRLEEILATREPDEVRAEAEAALGEADRLEATIAALLAVARGRTQEGRIDLASVVEERVHGWQPLFDAAHRRIVARCEARPDASAAETVVSQVLDVLVDNALHHGAGTVTVSVHDASGHPAVRVADEGAGVPTGMERAVFERHVSVSGRTGVGLALARTLAESTGGRLELVRARPAVFELYLTAWPGSAAPS